MDVDPETEPSFEEAATGRFSSAWVRKEVRRCVEGVARRSKVYSGIGIDIPTQVDVPFFP